VLIKNLDAGYDFRYVPLNLSGGGGKPGGNEGGEGDEECRRELHVNKLKMRPVKVSPDFIALSVSGAR
jgi:hypothetical protein